MAILAPYPVGAAANFFIRAAKADDRVLTHLTLQKLTYLSQGFHLVWANGTPLFSNPIEAWEWGPVVPILYHEFKTFGALHIDKPSFDVSFNARIGTVRFIRHYISKKDPAALHALRFTWKHFSQMTPSSLVALTHRVGAPWYTVYYSNKDDKEIKVGAMQRYFSGVLRERHRGGSKWPANWFR